MLYQELGHCRSFFVLTQVVTNIILPVTPAVYNVLGIFSLLSLLHRHIVSSCSSVHLIVLHNNFESFDII